MYYHRVLIVQDKLDVVKTREPEVEALQQQLEVLTEFAGQDHFNVVKLHKEFDDFTAKWANVVDKISELQRQSVATVRI